MKDNNQLPEPELGYIQTDKSNQPAFSARQMREAMGRVTQEEVTDAEIEALFGKCGGHWSGDQWVIEDADLHPFARAILALRPEPVPMTDLPEGDVTYFDGRGDAFDGYTAERVWEILRSHGITAQAKKEGA